MSSNDDAIGCGVHLGGNSFAMDANESSFHSYGHGVHLGGYSLVMESDGLESLYGVHLGGNSLVMDAQLSSTVTVFI
jgi:hypothetical protein